jgi:mannose-6-phosphate isomerase-like protein (cupin superfamily)
MASTKPKGGPLAASYTLKKLTDVKDSAPNFGYGEIQEARFANDELEAERTGLSYLRLKPGKRQGFAHRHDDAEEVYVVLSGSGRVKLDDEIVEIGRLDAIRVAPNVTRAFEAGEDGMEVLAFGPRHEGDGELIPNWWTD